MNRVITIIANKKEINLERNDVIMKKLMEEKTNPSFQKSVSLRKFIAINFQVFANSGKTTREIYEFLKEEGIDVSNFRVFKTLFSRVKRSFNDDERTAHQNLAEPSVSNSENLTNGSEIQGPSVLNSTQKIEKSETELDALPQKTRRPAFPITYLPGGAEAIIDPETGAKRFKI
jgi:hypothetical protein